MCEKVTGKMVVLKEQIAWKVVAEEYITLDYSTFQSVNGPYYPTFFHKNGWSRRVKPIQTESWDRQVTAAGYHVFNLRKTAVLWMMDHIRPKDRINYKVIKVKIRGKAFPIKGSYWNPWRGWAIEQWKVA